MWCSHYTPRSEHFQQDPWVFDMAQHKELYTFQPKKNVHLFGTVKIGLGLMVKVKLSLFTARRHMGSGHTALLIPNFSTWSASCLRMLTTNCISYKWCNTYNGQTGYANQVGIKHIHSIYDCSTLDIPVITEHNVGAGHHNTG
jgi:hypothetical protein